MNLFTNGSYIAKEGINLKIIYDQEAKEKRVLVNGIIFSVRDDKNYGCLEDEKGNKWLYFRGVTVFIESGNGKFTIERGQTLKGIDTETNEYITVTRCSTMMELINKAGEYLLPYFVKEQEEVIPTIDLRGDYFFNSN